MNRLADTNNFFNREVWSMMNAVLVTLLLVSGCTSGNATGGDATATDTSAHQSEIISFKIVFRVDWWIRVSQDGSGLIAYGRRNTTHLPSCALDFATWRNRVVALQWYDSAAWRESQHLDAPSVVIGVWYSNDRYEAFYLDPEKVPKELFQAAIDATTDERIRETWRKLPFE